MKEAVIEAVQRFFATKLPWLKILWLFFRHQLYKSNETYLLAGDETVVTKAGKQTHGVDRFFSGLLQKPVCGLAFFALSLIAVKERRSHPVSVEQVIKTSEEKAAAAASKANKKKKTKTKGRIKACGSQKREQEQRQKSN
jgi:hypothetical protein